jgi:hypothetical protein
VSSRLVTAYCLATNLLPHPPLLNHLLQHTKAPASPRDAGSQLRPQGDTSGFGCFEIASVLMFYLGSFVSLFGFGFLLTGVLYMYVYIYIQICIYM